MSNRLIKTLLLVFLQTGGCLATFADPALSAFASDTRYAAVGDSITHNGLYSLYTQLFYLTRFPQRDIEVVNVGIAGDSAAGCLKRVDWDIIPVHAGVVSVMFGMNDVHRELYAPGNVTADLQEKRQRYIDSYESNLRNLLARFKEQGLQLILLTPSIYDDTSAMETPNLPGVNGALEECAKRAQAIGAQLNIPVVDFYHPMRSINEQEQSKFPAFTLVGKDRVHPQEPGNFVMAYLFLKAQHLPAEVAKAAIDASRGTVAEAVHCEVDHVQKGSGTLKFRYTAQSLPFPVEDRAKPALAWVPFTEELNQETLKITGLASGSYQLEMDGISIRHVTSDELAQGINLAVEPNTPQAVQARQVLSLLRQRWEIIGKLRDIAFIESRVGENLRRPLGLEQTQPLIESFLKTLAGNPSENYYRRTCDAYLKEKPRQPELISKMEARWPQIREAAQPRPHQISIMPVQL